MSGEIDPKICESALKLAWTPELRGKTIMPRSQQRAVNYEFEKQRQSRVIGKHNNKLEL